jgi:hypothetical protein
MKSKLFYSNLWGSSIALSWMWGLGLFFSVQFTYQFGLFGLLTFAIPNAIGLMLFGTFTQMIANRTQGSESLANFFTNWSRPFRLIFFLYQILAITLTMFAIIRYLWQPLAIEPQALYALYLPLTVLIVGAAGCLFGEEFNIKRIKFSHGVLFTIMLIAILTLISGIRKLDNPVTGSDVVQMAHDWNFWGYAVPICIGLLLGPWLDLQQWQRAIQIHREGVSIWKSYLLGGTLFFLLLLFHGVLALWGMEHGAKSFIQVGRFDGLVYAQSILTSFFLERWSTTPWLFVAYATFISICVLTTLDSGYIALRWFLSQNVKASKNALFALIPDWLITSPIPAFIFAAVVTLFAVIVQLELEYFMIFYATFFVGYAALGICRCFMSRSGNALPQIKMFCVGSLAVVIFAYR